MSKHPLSDRIAAGMLRSQGWTQERIGRELGIPIPTVNFWFHREASRVRGARYRAENREAELARGARYRAENREAIRARDARYRAENLVPVRARAQLRQARYRAKNLEKVRAAILKSARKRRGWFEPDGLATQQEMEQFSERFNRI